MAEEIGAFSTPDARRVWKATLAVEKGTGDRNQGSAILEPEPIQFLNDTSETIPAYACMQITGTQEQASRNIFVVKKPIVTTNLLDDRFLFNSQYEVPAGQYGTAQTGCVFRAIKSQSFTAGDRIGPNNTEWTVGKGALFTYIGDDSVVSNCIRLVPNDGLILAVATTGVPARSGSTLGKASVSIKNLSISGSDRLIASTSQGVDAFNVASTAVASGAYVLLQRLGTVFVVIWEECPE